jgi:hypothetical protein
MSLRIKLAAMRVIKEVNGGLHDHVSVYRCVGSFGISVFYQPRRRCRSKASLVIGSESQAALHSGATAHIAQPSAGIVFRFCTSDAVIVATSPDHPRSGPVARRCHGVNVEIENNRLRKEKIQV